jgi:hypothetical protein
MDKTELIEKLEEIINLPGEYYSDSIILDKIIKVLNEEKK